ncbi:hypothetical protein [Clostridium chrysemydis]|uniref:hypothetical protein n=1 Tax=Clostridium chrysemydis TaxID=2665504 RepID=UPI001883B4CE|nr:hypothetical protein [Clostridium chrysemydis]
MILIYSVLIFIALNYLIAFIKLQRGKFPVDIFLFYVAEDLDCKSLKRAKILSFSGFILGITILVIASVSVVLMNCLLVFHAVIMYKLSKIFKRIKNFDKI